MNLIRNLCVCVVVFGVAAAASRGEIIVPTLNSSANLNAFNSEVNLTNNAGLSSPVNTGATLAFAQTVTHSYGGTFAQSYVTNASGSDYFSGSPAPTFIWDLGEDMWIGDVVLWQYQNDGGAGLNDQGNHLRTATFRVNTTAQGTGAFSGPTDTITVKPVQDNDGISGNDLAGVNSAQVFSIQQTGRYIQMQLTDNYRGFQGITLGGDRVGLGEFRANATEAFLVTPVGVTTNVAGDAGTNVVNLINGSGLSATPTLANFHSVTHAGYTNGSAHWVTNSPNGGSNDYFANNSTVPVLTFDLGGEFRITDLALWSYTGAAFTAWGNGPSEIEVAVSLNGIDFTQVAVVDPAATTVAQGSTGGQILSLNGAFAAAYVRLTLTDNYFGSLQGGDRVGLGEVRFISIVPAPAALPAGLALIALAAARRRR